MRIDHQYKTHIFDLPQRLSHNEFELLLKEICSKEVLYKNINFDFHKLSYIPSFRMLLFILLCEDLILNKHKKVRFTLSSPTNRSKLSSCIHILSRLGFFEALPDNISYYPYKPKRQSYVSGVNDAILEITKINNETEAQQIIDTVKKVIKINTSFTTGQIKDICIMVSEILQNIFYHSQCKRSSLIAIQRYPQLHLVQLVIADSGIGIPVTINTQKEYKDLNLTDSKAIVKSLEKGITQFGKEDDRGEGLGRCNELAKKHQADIYIRSNSGYFNHNYKTKKIFCSDISYFEGTQFYINFPSI